MVRETLTMQEVACRDANGVRREAFEGAVTRLELEDRHGGSLEEDGNLIVCDEAPGSSVLSQIAEVNPQGLIRGEVESTGPLADAQCGKDWTELGVGAVPLARDDVVIEVVLLFSKLHCCVVNGVWVNVAGLWNQLFPAVVEDNVLPNEGIRVWTLPVWVINSQICLLCSLAPFNAAVACKPSQVEPVGGCCLQ